MFRNGKENGLIAVIVLVGFAVVNILLGSSASCKSISCGVRSGFAIILVDKSAGRIVVVSTNVAVGAFVELGFSVELSVSVELGVSVELVRSQNN